MQGHKKSDKIYKNIKSDKNQISVEKWGVDMVKWLMVAGQEVTDEVDIAEELIGYFAHRATNLNNLLPECGSSFVSI